jgi:hypothetical protein
MTTWYSEPLIFPMASTAIRRMPSTPSLSAPLLISPLASLWAASPKPIVAPLQHLGDQRFSLTLVPLMVSSLLTPWGDATKAILGVTALSVDPAASTACGFTVAIPMVDTTKA